MKLLFIISLANCMLVGVYSQFNPFTPTSHIGPVTQIVHYGFETISCASKIWVVFRDDGFGGIADQISKANFFAYNIDQQYQNFNSTARTLSYNRRSLYSLVDSSIKLVRDIEKILRNFNSSIVSSDDLVKKTIDDLTRNTYDKSISSIYKSVQSGKDCVPDILKAQQDINSGFLFALNRCTRRNINFDILDYQLSSAYSILNAVFSQLQLCFNNTKNFTNFAVRRKAESCIRTILRNSNNTNKDFKSFTDLANRIVNNLNNSYPAFTNYCIDQVKIEVNIKIGNMTKVAATCEKCKNCDGGFKNPAFKNNSCGIPGSDLSLITTIFQSSDNYLTIAENAWKNYRDDAVQRIKYMYGKGEAIQFSVSNLFNLINVPTIRDKFPEFSVFYSNVVKKSLFIDDLYYLAYDALKSFNDYYRTQTDSVIITMNSYLNSTLVRNWNITECRSRIFEYLFYHAEIAANNFAFSMQSKLDFSPADILLSNFYLLFSVFSQNSTACFDKFNTTLNPNLLSNLTDCLKQSFQNFSSLNETFHENYDAATQWINTASIGLENLLKKYYNNDSFGALYDTFRLNYDFSNFGCVKV